MKKLPINIKGEIWKPIVGYEEYLQISNIGDRIKVLARKIAPSNRKIKEKIIIPKMYSRDIKIAVININSTKVQLSYHIEKARAFINNPNMLNLVRHKDGNKLNNDLDNLEWVVNISKKGLKEKTKLTFKRRDNPRSDIIENRINYEKSAFVKHREINKVNAQISLLIFNIKRVDTTYLKIDQKLYLQEAIEALDSVFSSKIKTTDISL